MENRDNKEAEIDILLAAELTLCGFFLIKK